MSSRCISISLIFSLFWIFISACTDLTREDFPVPLAPHNSALFAGKLFAKFCVFFNKISF